MSITNQFNYPGYYHPSPAPLPPQPSLATALSVGFAQGTADNKPYEVQKGRCDDGFGLKICFNGDLFFGHYWEAGTPKRGLSIQSSGYVTRIVNGQFIPHPKENELNNLKDKEKIIENDWAYVGQCCNGKPEGIGMLYLRNGTLIVGQFLQGKPHGKVSIERPDFRDYEGDVKEGVVHGFGCAWKDGGVYEGYWEQGKPHGLGVLKEADGTVLVGRFEKGIYCPPSIISLNGEDEVWFKENFFPIYAQCNKQILWLPQSVYQGEIEQQQPHGWGIRYYPNGIVVHGFFQSGLPDGFARIDFPNKKFYQGEWKTGSPSGYGIGSIKLKDQHIYQGSWEKGEPHGVGVLKNFETGEIFCGKFLKGVYQPSKLIISLEGLFGRCATAYQDSVYDGQMFAGKPHGVGVLYSRDGKVTQGEFKNGDLHGRGRIDFPNGSYYEGQWEEGLLHGFGILEDREKKLEGDWKRGKLHGKAKACYKDQSLYEGNFREGVRHGRGKWQSKDGFYDGGWVRGKRHGYGISKSQSEGNYEGDWKENLREGFGVLVQGDSIYTGNWKKGMRHGHGLQKKGDEELEGAWVNGEFQETEYSQIRNRKNLKLGDEILKDLIQEFEDIPNAGDVDIDETSMRKTEVDRVNNPCLEEAQTRLHGKNLCANKPKYHPNANKIHLKGTPTYSYIAAQAPKREHAEHFYKMLVQSGSEDFVNLTSLKEQEAEPALCMKNTFLSKGWKIEKIESIQKIGYQCIHLKKPLIEKPKLPEELRIHRYAHWINQESISCYQLYRLIQCVSERANPDSTKPLIVQSLNGRGRAGAFIAAYHAIQTDAKLLQIVDLIEQMRTQRIGACALTEHFVLCLETLALHKKIKNNLSTIKKNSIHEDTRIFLLNELKNQFIKLPNAGVKEIDLSKIPFTPADRFSNCPCLPQTRVKLIKKPCTSKTRNDMNANWVDIEGFPRRLIAAQAPLKSYAPNFLDMIDERNCSDVVCLVSENENTNDDSLLAYFKQTRDLEIGRGNWDLDPNVEVDDPFGYAKHHLKNKTKTIAIHHFVNWPDQSLISVKHLRSFIQKVDQSMDPDPSKVCLVHCKAGVNRTGVFITSLVAEKTNPHFRDLIRIISLLRQKRLAALSNPEHFELVLQVLAKRKKEVSRNNGR
jgi:protein tyrosine phosphatase